MFSLKLLVKAPVAFSLAFRESIARFLVRSTRDQREVAEQGQGAHGPRTAAPYLVSEEVQGRPNVIHTIEAASSK